MSHPNPLTALDMLEYCRFIYRTYAQSCVYPMDPFFESHGKGVWQGARDRLIAAIHDRLESPKELRRFDPIEYDLEHTPHPRRGIVYRAGTGDEPFILFQPRKLDMKIKAAVGFDLTGKQLDSIDISGSTEKLRCGHFQGKTGMTKTYPTAGWTSWLGACVYDPDQKRMVVVFRGSRSGAGGRALGQALLYSTGNPDWVTDMNHLKGVKVKDLGGVVMACGFWHAYESCKASLEAAFCAALGSGKLDEIIFTGHSLGGALAQCAYVDMVGGTLFSKNSTLRPLKSTLPIHCYAMSAPPICLDKDSAHGVELIVGDAKVYHYFAPKDAVHDSPEVAFSGASVVSSLTDTVTHPTVTPVHIGVEIKLVDCKEKFPAAHEPAVVHKGLLAAIKRDLNMGLPADPGFWPIFKFHPLEPWGRVVSDVQSGLEKLLVDALACSASKAAADERASQWGEIAKGKDKGGYESLDFEDGEAFEYFKSACELIHDLGNPFGCEDRSGKTAEVKKIRALLLKHYGTAKNHKASSSCVWTMMQYLSVRQHDVVII